MALSDQDRGSLRLIQRSPDRGDGWRTCADKVFEVLIRPLPPELVEVDEESTPKRVRLTEAGEAVVTWV